MVPATFPGWSDRSQCTPTTYLPCTRHGHDATRGHLSSPSLKRAGLDSGSQQLSRPCRSGGCRAPPRVLAVSSFARGLHAAASMMAPALRRGVVTHGSLLALMKPRAPGRPDLAATRSARASGPASRPAPAAQLAALRRSPRPGSGQGGGRSRR